MQTVRRQGLRRQLLLVGMVGLLASSAIPAQSEPTTPGIRPVVDESMGNYAYVENLVGAFTVAGSDTMQPLVARLASEFRRVYPETKIAVQGSGSISAIDQFLYNQATIRRGDANPKGHLVSGHVSFLATSRPLSEGELKDFKSRNGYEPIGLPIALDAVAIYVNQENPIRGLTFEQIDGMFGATRKRAGGKDINEWGEVGLDGGWEHQPIHLYGRDKRSATREFFSQHVLLGGDFRGSIKEEPGAASVILSIARDPAGIGFGGVGLQSTLVRPVPIAETGGQPFIAPSAHTAADGSYPLRRALYLYVNKEPGQELKPVLLEFLRFVNSREGQQIVAKTGNYPLTAAQIAHNISLLTGSLVRAAAVVDSAQ
ncbi:MAG: PstS family phosphate ABC transporter substrate-binding protein [Nitrospiraceae bacterium]